MINKYFTGEQWGNYHKKKGRDKLPLFCGNGERVITIYAVHEIYKHPGSVEKVF